MTFATAVVCAARVSQTAVVAATKTASTVTPADTHTTTKTVRHEAVYDWVGTALYVWQQVSGQLLTTITSHHMLINSMVSVVVAIL